ncbi:MAG: hypothetical protein ACAI34_05800 [Verrucomicrobium sp.]|nr:hypothetical protein [Verrucomicrobium sp.]
MAEANSHPAPESNAAALAGKGVSSWFGSGAVVAVIVLILGRLALEPLRSLPHFDVHGMDAYGAVETYVLKNRTSHAPVEVACFGSSQSVFGILPEEVAHGLGEPEDRVLNLGTAGGTPFDMWSLVRRNPERFKDLHLAVVEINPFVLNKGLENDDRLLLSISQKASLEERLMISNRPMRCRQVADLVVPLYSVRRSLRSLFLNILDPSPGNDVCPCPEQRIHPAAGWAVDKASNRKDRERQTTSAQTVAKRFFGTWKVSHLQDESLRHLLAWFHEHHVPVVLHQMPIHPEVAHIIESEPKFHKNYVSFSQYIESLSPSPAAVIRIMGTADCGASESDLADRTHLNQLGAGIYSRFLAEKIKTGPVGPLVVPQGG